MGDAPLARIVDGRPRESSYDVRGRLVRSVDANGNVTTRDYDALDNLQRVVLPELTQPEDTYPSGRGLSLRRLVEVTTTYDLLGRVTSETDRNGLTLFYEHAARGQVKRVTRSFGGGEKLFRYDDAGNLVFETDWKGVETTHGYDALDRRTTSTNRRGDTMTRRYDAFGNLVSVDDFEGNTTTFTYDALDRVSSKRRTADRGEHLEFAYFDEADAEANLRTVTVHRAPYTPATYTFTIDSRYQRLSRTGPEGLDEQWTYDARGDVETFTDSLGRATTHVYDERRRLREVQQTRREGDAVRVVTVARLGYDPAGNPTTRTDARGLTTTTRYDEWNRPWQVEDAAGFVASTLRDGEGHVLNVRNPRGFDDTTLRDPLGRATQHVDALGHTSRVRTYDANSNPEVVENARAVVTRIAYDAEDQEVSVEEGTGAVTPEGTPDYAGAVSARTMEIVERDAMGNVRRVRDARGVETEYQYDASYRLTGVLVDAYPEVPDGETCAATGSARPSVHRSYSQNGLLLSETNRRCHTTHYEHDERDRVRFVTNARGDQVEQQYDAADRVVRSRNPRGYVTEMALDDFDRVTEVAVLDGPTRLVQSRYEYDAVGNLRFETDANGNTTEIVYAEDRNLPVRVNLPRVEGEGAAPFRVTTYDANGNPQTITNENGQLLTIEYDGLDRLIRSEFGGEVTTYAYDPHGNLRYATPPESQPGGRNAGRVRVMHYDPFDRLERVVEPNGLQTQYRYDPNGNLVGVTDPSNRRTEYRYDRLNRRTHHVVLGPDDAVETDDLITQWELDANGNARRITDPLGQVVEYEYDDLDRRDRGVFPAARNPAVETALREVRWVYDANGNVDRVEADKVFGAEAWTETTVQSWDALDRLEATTTRGVTIDLGYDAAGNRTRVSTAEGSTTYAYDARHRLDYAVVDSERVEYASLTDGRMDSVLYPNGTRTTYDYHPQTNRLTSLNHERNDGGWTSFARAEVDWDRNGNRLEDRITLGGVTETTEYEYDVLDRMVRHSRQSSTGGTPETVTYDYSGYERSVERTIPSLNPEDDPNRIRTYTYEPSYGWLTQVADEVVGEGTTTVTYGYDRNGNTSWRRNSRNSEEMRFTYDVFDQLQHVERGDTSGGPGDSLGRYDYDVDGRRIRVRGGDRGDVDYYYDGLSVLQEMRPGATLDTDPTELLAHYRYADRLLSLDRYVSGGNARQWYHHDTLGSVMALSAGVAESEAAGTMLASYRYDPYGAVREQTGESVNRAGFTGHQQDRETGLIYMNARYYDPEVGRFLTADSYLGESGNPPSLQRYLYGFGNPGRYVDPTGHWNEELDLQSGEKTTQFENQDDARAWYVLSRSAGDYAEYEATRPVYLEDERSPRPSRVAQQPRAAGPSNRPAPAVSGTPHSNDEVATTYEDPGALQEVRAEQHAHIPHRVWGRSAPSIGPASDGLLREGDALPRQQLRELRDARRRAEQEQGTWEPSTADGSGVPEFFAGLANTLQQPIAMAVSTVTHSQAPELLRTRLLQGRDVVGFAEDAGIETGINRQSIEYGLYAPPGLSLQDAMLLGIPVGPVSRARRETAEVGGGFLDDLAGMYRRWREEGVSPQDLGLNGSIADDPVLHRLFEDAMRSAASSRRNNKYKELLRIYERGDVPSQEELQLAWDTVSGKFIRSARRLNYTIAEVHHWNFPKNQFPLQVFDPRNLYITSTRAQHELLHRLTTFTRRLWNGPVDEVSRMVFDDVYYLAPRP